MDELLYVGGWVLFLMAMSFVLGASLMWSLEGRERRFQPTWLVVARNLLMIGLALLVIGAPPPPPDATISLAPVVVRVAGVVALCAALLVFGVELRHRARQRHA